MKKCIIQGCNNEADKGRRYCHSCYLKIKSEQRAKRKALGLQVRTLYECVCLNCGKQFKGFTKNSKYCSKGCFKQSFTNTKKNPYKYDSQNYKQNLWQHRNIVENVLKRKLNTNEVIHHMDLNPLNNELTNLIVLSRSKHSSLHQYLNKQGAILKRLSNANFENCWNNLIVPMTTTWLETANVKVIKLWEIGQSAAKPLLNGEGSETMHKASLVDDDIVQTTKQ